MLWARDNREAPTVSVQLVHAAPWPSTADGLLWCAFLPCTLLPTDSSNTTLGAAKDEFTDHKGINKQGSKLLNTLHKQERNDRWAGLQ